MKTLQQIETEAREYFSNRAKEVVEQASQVRRITALLDGYDYRVYGAFDECLTVNLGVRPTRKRDRKGHREFDRIRANLREAIGSRIVYNYNTCHDESKRLVTMVHHADEMSFVEVKWVEKLPPKAKCRIVRKRESYTHVMVVCDRE